MSTFSNLKPIVDWQQVLEIFLCKWMTENLNMTKKQQLTSSERRTSPHFLQGVNLCWLCVYSQRLCSEARLLFDEAVGSAPAPPIDHLISSGRIRRTWVRVIFGTHSSSRHFIGPLLPRCPVAQWQFARRKWTDTLPVCLNTLIKSD